MRSANGDEDNDSPIKQVRLTVPPTDDPTQPTLTFRTWVLGLISCVVLSFVNQFFAYRQNQLSITPVIIQILVLSLGKLMSAYLPSKPIRVPLTNWSFSLNPGPFNLKEHVLITIFANSGADGVYALHIVTGVKAFYHRSISGVAAYILSLTTQVAVQKRGAKKAKGKKEAMSYLSRDEDNDSPIEQVRLTVPPTDDPTQPTLTFRTWEHVLITIFANSGAGGVYALHIVTGVKAFYHRSISGVAAYILSLTTQMPGYGWAGLFRKYLVDSPYMWWPANLVQVSLFRVALAMFACEGFDKQLQLPWWGLLMACGIALFFTLPIGIIQATTNTQPGLNMITELVIGYIYPGKPLANVAFKTYGYISMSQALYFLVGTLVASSTYFATAWWLLSSIKDICDPLLLPEGSPWTCPGDDVFYNASIIWGVIGPLRMFKKYGIYKEMNWFFLLGFLAPIPGWFLSRKYPNIKWLRLINMPIIIGATSSMPPTKAVNYWAWGAVGIFFNFYIYRKFKAWWARHAYVLSAALDAGVAFLGIMLFFTLQSKNVIGPEWWKLDMDHCPLASCPTAPVIVKKGCPVF
ncbi:oligopeptide transporter 1 [Quercus suber]|uniref:Oligopeptide transporter 1 n=1 Tax=Quercus suber TaxID=58331 RepID=A0AAW0J3M3_QUESU